MILVKNNYHNLGRLSSRKFAGSTTNIEAYTYDVRSRTTGITHPSFIQDLTYTYGSDISSSGWKRGSNDTRKAYDFTYDSLSCELHLRLKRDNNCYVTNAPDSLICFSPGERLYEEFDLLVEKKVQQYIRANDVSSFLKLYQMFTGITVPPSPEDAFRIIIHEGRVYDSSHWEYSIAPVRMIIAGETIKPEDTLDRIIEEKKKALLMI